MSRDWTSYITSTPTDAGRALVLQGARLDEARRQLSDDRYARILDKAGLTPREAATLANIGRKLHYLLDELPEVRLPYRLRTLTALCDLSTEQVNQAAREGLIRPSMTEIECKAMRPPASEPISPVIRPTDSWNFGRLRWPRIDGFEGHGYIPGDLYANCIWFYAKAGDVVLDPMAGSGMLLHIWKEHHDWLNGHHQNITILTSDLAPRGPYAEQILQHDLTVGPPNQRADYIIIDPPYPELATGQYTQSPNDLANMAPDQWIRAIAGIARGFYDIQPSGGRCTVVIPNNRNINTGDRALFPDAVRQEFKNAGYRLYDTVYASRRIQQQQGRRMAILNNKARRARVPMTEISEVLTFLKEPSSAATDTNLQAQ